ncbi:MAG: PEP-CTERM sorting domain-containing protein [Bryobacterales bacterium]|nr:PEP-CTERM sorting domain-containing protein [Bryobacterales bacterium]
MKQAILAAGVFLGGAIVLPAGLVNFDDVSGPLNTHMVTQSNHYSGQGVTIQTIVNATDGKAVGDTFSATLRNDGAGAGAFSIIHVTTTVSTPNMAAAYHRVCNPTCHAVFASDELLFTFATPVTSASLFTDTAPAEGADVVRLMALRRLAENQYQILAIATGLDNATTAPGNFLQVSVAGGFTHLLFETTTEAEGVDNLSFSPVPEPSAAALTALGAAGVLLRRRLRR